MAEKFEQNLNKDITVNTSVAWSKKTEYLANNVSLHNTNDLKAKQESLVDDPGDFYNDNKMNTIQDKTHEVKEVESGVFVYEIQDKRNIGFGKNINSEKPTPYQIDFVVNWPLVQDEITYVTKKDTQGNEYQDPYMLPRWWYIDNGKQEKPFIDPEPIWKNFGDNNWIFGLDTYWNFHIVPYADLNNTNIDWQWAFQNWPILLLDGQNPHNPNTQSKYNRSWIWYRANGTSIVIYSETPKNFYEFADLFKKQGCVCAMYLDGLTDYAGYVDGKGNHWYLNDIAIKLQFFTQP